MPATGSGVLCRDRSQRGDDQRASSWVRPRTGRWLRRPRIALALVGCLPLIALTVAQIVSHGARAVASGEVAPTPQPVLGTADANTVLMGAATAGASGEAWAYRVYRMMCRLRSLNLQMATFATPSTAMAAPGHFFERATDADPDWTIVETPLGEKRSDVYRGITQTGSRRGSHRTAVDCWWVRTRRARAESRRSCWHATGRALSCPARTASGCAARGGRSRRKQAKRRYERRGRLLKTKGRRDRRCCN